MIGAGTRRALQTTTVALLSFAAAARAQSLVEEAPDDPCVAARSLAIDDASPDAERVRRGCRLEHFEGRLTAERRRQVAVDERAREARVQAWLDATQPARVTHPIAVEGFVGTGLVSGGLAASWDFLRQGELGAWIGWRPISCADGSGNTTSSCGRTAFGLRGRWYLSASNFTPFLDGGLSIMSSQLQLFSDTGNGSTMFLSGSGRANSLSAGAGLGWGFRAVRMSLEYIYEYAFYTGASLDDEKKTPSPALANALSDSLRSDRNGFRFQVGYAF